MLIKIGDTYIKQDIEITVERRNKVIDQIADSVGDFSYSFDIERYSEIDKILGLNNIDNLSKFTGFEGSLSTSGGITLYTGNFRVDGWDNKRLSCSFYSGNTNWISLIQGKLIDLNLAQYGVNQNTNDINEVLATWNNTEGVIYTIFDKGALQFRKSPVVVYDVAIGTDQTRKKNDLKPFIYVKTLVKEVFKAAGLKITGDLLADPIYNKLITTANNNEFLAAERDKRTVKARNATVQGITTSYAVIAFTDITTRGYGDGSQGNYTTLNYVADRTLFLRIQSFIRLSVSRTIEMQAYRNGTDAGSRVSTGVNVEFDFGVTLNQGDVLQIRVRTSSSTANILADSWLRLSPTQFRTLFPQQLIGDLDRIEFVQNIFNMFNVLPTYDPFTKTVSMDLFKNIKNNPEVDLSEYLVSYEVNTEEVMQDYGQRNFFNYSQMDLEQIESYNNNYTVEYGCGKIDADNIHAQSESDLIDLDLVAPFVYNNPGFLLQLCLANYIETEEDLDFTGTVNTVTNSGGNAQFNMSSLAHVAGQMVRHSGFTNENYNGDFVVLTGGTSYTVIGCPFTVNDTGTSSYMDYTEQNQDDQVIALVHNYTGPTLTISISNDQTATHSTTTRTTYPLAIFHLFDNYNKIDLIKQSLAFDVLEGDFNYQQGLIDTYYSEIRTMANNPTLVRAQMLIPENVFLSLDSRNFVKLGTKEFNSRFYLDSITGYENSYTPCEVNLIKV